MEQRSLASRDVEYIIVTPSRRRVTRRTLTVVGLTLAFLAVAGGWYFAHDRPHLFKPRDLPTLGLRAGLRTKWVDGAPHYVFRAAPLPGKEDAFNRILQSASGMPFHFQIKLADKDGFTLCSSVPDLIRLHGTDGRFNGLRAEQIFPTCSEKEYGLAERWDITFNEAIVPQPVPLIMAPQKGSPIVVPKSTPASGLSLTGNVMVTRLTGSDFTSGDVETVDAGSFRISRHAEYMTVLTWDPGAVLKITCQKTSCLITNTTVEQSVHARRK